MSSRNEWLMLADHAEVIGGKLYIHGGAWDRLTVGSRFPHSRIVGIAASFVVPWNETNRKIAARIEIQTEDGAIIGKLETQFEVGRPAGIPPGQDQRFQLAANVPMKFDEAGVFALVGYVDGEESARTPFYVVAGPGVQEKAEQATEPPG